MLITGARVDDGSGLYMKATSKDQDHHGCCAWTDACTYCTHMHTNISASPSIPSCGRDYFNFAQPALAMAYSDHSDFMRMLSDLTNDLSEIRLFDLKLQGQVRIQLGSYW